MKKKVGDGLGAEGRIVAKGDLKCSGRFVVEVLMMWSRTDPINEVLCVWSVLDKNVNRCRGNHGTPAMSYHSYRLETQKLAHPTAIAWKRRSYS